MQCWKMPTRITPNMDTFYAKFSILRLFMRSNIRKKCVLKSLTKIYQAFDISATLVKCFSAVGAKIYNAITFICLNLMLKNFSIASKYCIFQTINKPEILKKNNPEKNIGAISSYFDSRKPIVF